MPNDNKHRTMPLPVALTEAERVKFMDELVTCLNVIGGLDKERRRIAKEYRDERREHSSRVEKLRICLEANSELRVVEVEERLNLNKGLVETIRLDTGEYVEEREATADDRQMGLDETEGGNDAESGSNLGGRVTGGEEKVGRDDGAENPADSERWAREEEEQICF